MDLFADFIEGLIGFAFFSLFSIPIGRIGASLYFMSWIDSRRALILSKCCLSLGKGDDQQTWLNEIILSQSRYIYLVKRKK